MRRARTQKATRWLQSISDVWRRSISQLFPSLTSTVGPSDASPLHRADVPRAASRALGRGSCRALEHARSRVAFVVRLDGRGDASEDLRAFSATSGLPFGVVAPALEQQARSQGQRAIHCAAFTA